MNAIQADVDATVRRIHAADFTDMATGKQAESVKIDKREVMGVLSFEPTDVELIFGGTNEDIKGVFSALKSYWPNGDFPKVFKSTLECIVNGAVESYQVRQLNGDKNNGARLMIGLAALHNRK